MQFLFLSTGVFPDTSANLGNEFRLASFVEKSPALHRFANFLLNSVCMNVVWGILVFVSVMLGLAEQPKYNMGKATYITFLSIKCFCLLFFWVRMILEIVFRGVRRFVGDFASWIEVAVNVFGILQVIPPTHQIRWMRAWEAARPLTFLRKIPVVCELWRVLLRSFSIYSDVAFTFCVTFLFFATLGCLAFSDLLTTGESFADRIYGFKNVGTSILLLLKVFSADQWYTDVDKLMRVRGAGSALYYVVAVAEPYIVLLIGFSTILYFYERRAVLQRKLEVASSGQTEKKRDVGVQTDRRVGSGVSVEEHKTALNGNTPSTGQHRLKFGRFRNFVFDVRRYRWREAFFRLEKSTYRTPSESRGILPICASVVDSRPFIGLLMLASLASVVLLCVLYAGMGTVVEQKLLASSAAISVFFVLPVLLRVLGFGVLSAGQDMWSWFDILAAATGVIELAGPGLFRYAVVRGIRVIRCVHFLKYVTPFVNMNGLSVDLLAAYLLCAFALFLYALCGKELFSNYFVEPDNFARGSFSTSWGALLFSFIIFTGARWYDSLMLLFQSGTYATGVLFVLSLLFWSFLMLQPLILTILTHKVYTSETENDVNTLPKLFPPRLMMNPVQTEAAAPSEKKVLVPPHPSKPVRGHPLQLETLSFRRRVCIICGVKVNLLQKQFSRANTLFVFSPMNPVRRFLTVLIGSIVYACVAQLMVILGIVALFFEKKHMSEKRNVILHKINIAYTVFFFVEMGAKLIVYGGFLKEEGVPFFAKKFAATPYFRNPVSYLDVVANGLSLAGVYYAPMRVGRVVRSLRLLSSHDRMNVYFTALARCLAHVWRVLVYLAVLYVFFAVLGMQFFAGRLHHCTDPTMHSRDDCLGLSAIDGTSSSASTSAPAEVDNRWVSPFLSYDHFGKSVLTVFVVSTTSDWTPYMWAGMSTTGETTDLKHFYSGYYVFFYVMILLVFRLFGFRLFCATFMAPYRREKRLNDGSLLESDEHISFLASEPLLSFVADFTHFLSPLPNRVSKWFHILLMTESSLGYKWVDLFICLYMMVNCGFLAALHVGAPLWLKEVCRILDYVGFGLLCVEFLVRFLTYGVKFLLNVRFFFDLVIIVVLIVTLAMHEELYFLHTLRFVKVIMSSGVMLSFMPLKSRHLYILNAIVLYLFILFCYAVVGTVLFGNLVEEPFLSEERNFSTVIGSFLVLFNCSTFDAWEKVMLAAVQGSSAHFAVPYFVSFMVICIIQHNLFSVVCLEVYFCGIDYKSVQECLQIRKLWVRMNGHKFRTKLHLFEEVYPIKPHETVLCQLSLLQLSVDEKWNIYYKDLMRGWAWKVFRVQWFLGGKQKYCPTNSSAAELYCILLKDSGSSSTDAAADRKGVQVDGLETPTYEESYRSHNALEEGEDNGLRFRDASTFRGTLNVPETDIFLFQFLEEKPSRTPWRANMEDVFLFCDMLRGEDISEVLLRESVNFSGWPSSTERLRSVRWQLLLGTLPDRCPPGEFLSYATEAIKKQQQDWVQCIDLVEPFAPHRDTREGDKTSQPKKKVMKFDESSSSSDETTMGENPLVPAASTYYAQEHRYRILLREIQKDVERIFWEFSLFEKKSTKVDIETLLLAYCLLHDKDYKQGMHEIVAFCYFCVYRDRELLKEMDPMVRENYGEVMTFLDSAVEHSLSTTFALFCAILNEGDTFVGLSRFFYREERCEQSAVLVCAERVQQDILLTLDPPLLHLIDSEYGISSATYLIRWLRLLFIREFSFSQVLHIWDLIFAERYLHQRRDRPYFIENGIILYISAVMIKHVKPAILQGADSALRVLMKYPPVTDAFPALLKEAVILSNGALQPLLSVTSPTGVVAVDEGAVSRQGAKLSETIKTLEVILNRSTTDETASDSLDAMVDCIAELKKIRDVLLYGVSD